MGNRVDASIPDSTKLVIQQSTFRMVQEPYLFVKAGAVRSPERHLLVCRDELETTVVTHASALGEIDVLETNQDRWILFSIDCANPFYCVGFIASIANTLVDRQIDILAVSTFTRDLIFVKETAAASARQAMLDIGFQEWSEPDAPITRGEAEPVP